MPPEMGTVDPNKLLPIIGADVVTIVGCGTIGTTGSTMVGTDIESGATGISGSCMSGSTSRSI